MKISKLEVVMSLWSVSRVNMCNTTLKTVVVHPVVIVEVHDNHVIATWNGNAPRRFGESVVKGWKKEKPLLSNPLRDLYDPWCNGSDNLAVFATQHSAANHPPRGQTGNTR